MKNVSGFSRMYSESFNRGMTIVEVLLATMLGAFCLCEIITFNLSTERTVIEAYRRVRIKVAADTASRLAERIDTREVGGLMEKACSGIGFSFGTNSPGSIGINWAGKDALSGKYFGWVEARTPRGNSERRVYCNVR